MQIFSGEDGDGMNDMKHGDLQWQIASLQIPGAVGRYVGPE